MTLRGATLSMSADVDGDGTDEDGVFDFSGGINIEPGIRTGDLIGQTGSQASAIVDYVKSESGRSGFNLDIGGGAAVYRISFRNWEGSSGQWGDGSSDPKADATGEDVWRQMSVWQRYLDWGTYDSRNAATLEWGDYSQSGAYSPIAVTIEEPSASFTAEKQTSVYEGDITLISISALEKAAVSQAQDQR